MPTLRQQQLALKKKYCFFQAEDGIRDWSVTGVQTCALPAWLKAECTTSRTAWSTSAVEPTMIDPFPLVSARILRLGAQRAKLLAVSQEPVRTTALTSGCVTRRWPGALSVGATSWRTCSPKPAACSCSTSTAPVAIAGRAGFRITVLPAASAARTPPAGIENGKFHGGDTTTTPRGELATSQSSSPNSDDSEPVPSAYHRAKSTASETSGSASSKVLPASEAITAMASARAGPGGRH